MLPLLLILPAWTEPPKAAELTPVAKVEPKPTDPIPVEINKYKVYQTKIEDPPLSGKWVPYKGPVTWMAEGEAVGIKESTKEMTLFGVVSGQTDPTETPVPAGAVVIWGKAPGATKVAAWGVVDNRATLLATLLFQVGPRPPPKPDPVPDPSPAVGKLFGAIVIDQSRDVWPQRGRCKVVFDNWMDEQKLHRRWVEPTVVDPTGQTPADLKPWIDRAKGKGVPYIFLVTEKGGILHEGPCPQTPNELISLVTRIWGQ